MSEKILYFRGDYDFLSNFHPSPVEMDGMTYPTVEHAYQAAKTDDKSERARIAKLDSPGKAKRAGAKIKPPNNWRSYNLQLMESLIEQKFTNDPDLRAKLIATGDAELVEGNNWNDRFFGRVYDSKKQAWVGENQLGKMLMRVRDRLSTSA